MTGIHVPWMLVIPLMDANTGLLLLRRSAAHPGFRNNVGCPTTAQERMIGACREISFIVMTRTLVPQTAVIPGLAASMNRFLIVIRAHITSNVTMTIFAMVSKLVRMESVYRELPSTVMTMIHALQTAVTLKLAANMN